MPENSPHPLPPQKNPDPKVLGRLGSRNLMRHSISLFLVQVVLTDLLANRSDLFFQKMRSFFMCKPSAGVVNLRVWKVNLIYTAQDLRYGGTKAPFTLRDR